jgi:endonuclease G
VIAPGTGFGAVLSAASGALRTGSAPQPSVGIARRHEGGTATPRATLQVLSGLVQNDTPHTAHSSLQVLPGVTSTATATTPARSPDRLRSPASSGDVRDGVGGERTDGRSGLSSWRHQAERLLLDAGVSPRRLQRAVDNVGLGLPSPASKNNPGDYLVARNDYVLSYNAERLVPNWASWLVTAADLGPVKRSGDFRPDPTLPRSWRRATDQDYRGSGFTRGHLVASGERTWSRRANSKTFVLTNIMPQSLYSNNGPWNQLESYYRDLVRTGRQVYVMAGGIYDGPKRTIGQGVTVPSHMWKVALVLEAGQTLRDITASTQVLSILVPNGVGDLPGPDVPWQQFRVPVRAIEKATGLRFFSALPVNLREVLVDKVEPGAEEPKRCYPFCRSRRSARRHERRAH